MIPADHHARGRGLESRCSRCRIGTGVKRGFESRRSRSLDGLTVSLARTESRDPRIVEEVPPKTALRARTRMRHALATWWCLSGPRNIVVGLIAREAGESVL